MIVQAEGGRLFTPEVFARFVKQFTEFPSGFLLSSLRQ
jgi:hypothetical protein